MIIDELGLLRGDGEDPVIGDDEIGVADDLERDSDTGQAVIEICKTGIHGLPIVVITSGDLTGSNAGDSFVVTIEAADDIAFSGTPEVVATFPAVVNDAEPTLMVRRVHTQKRYLRSVITFTGTPSDLTADFLIFIGHALMNT